MNLLAQSTGQYDLPNFVLAILGVLVAVCAVSVTLGGFVYFGGKWTQRIEDWQKSHDKDDKREFADCKERDEALAAQVKEVRKALKLEVDHL